MLDPLISLIAPHSCVSCGQIGQLLCAACSDNQIESRREICISCGCDCSEGICGYCRTDWNVERALIFSERTAVLKQLIDEYKYGHKRAAHRELAKLMASLLPYRTDATLVPIPTIAKHIRQRGYDHMALLARSTARRNRLNYSPLLIRRTDSVQHGATRSERLSHAQTAFAVRGTINPSRPYILFDDITTTGASLKAAARVLREAGAQHIWVAALARQPLD